MRPECAERCAERCVSLCLCCPVLLECPLFPWLPAIRMLSVPVLLRVVVVVSAGVALRAACVSCESGSVLCR